ncbi:hypothetical protein N9Z23_03710 [Akkermansiaceae bacterium]|nr:hypothetical protein [Akkermansiaceae bacterium]
MLKEPWYSRNSGMLKYGDTLKAWILQYRKEWQRDDFQFLVVMPPGYSKGVKEGPENPDSLSWAWMRESQLKALELPHTAVVNTIDLGHATNIHPKDKLPIGRRLAQLATSKAQGPKFNTAKVKGSEIIVQFDHAKGLKTLDGKTPTGFWIANDSKTWVKADATINGSSVTLTSSEVKSPLYVRYAFSGKPTVNLVNHSNLPAYPFRTDSFAPR